MIGCLKKYAHSRAQQIDFPMMRLLSVVDGSEVILIEGSNMIFHTPSVFNTSLGTLRMLMNDKIMFDRYYCINSAKHCENKENIGTLYFITSSHFPTLVCF